MVLVILDYPKKATTVKYSISISYCWSLRSEIFSMTFRNDCHSMNEQYSTFLGWYILCSDKWWWVRVNAFKSPSSEMGMINPINYTTSTAWKMINMWKSDLESFPYRKQPRQKQKEEEREKKCFKKEHILRIPGSEWYLPRPFDSIILCVISYVLQRVL